jgi:hypothetical protein
MIVKMGMNNSHRILLNKPFSLYQRGLRAVMRTLDQT